MSNVLVEVNENIAVITINKPEALNALNEQVLVTSELHQKMQSLDSQK